MAPGTIYMYYARGHDSLNFSARGEGNAVLIKAGHPYVDRLSPPAALEHMHAINPGSNRKRSDDNLCSGQTLLCRSLGLKVIDWNQQSLSGERLRLDDIGYTPEAYVQCRRLGIPKGRDEDLPYRFVDVAYARYCTSNPLTKRSWKEGVDYEIKRLGFEP